MIETTLPKQSGARYLRALARLTFTTLCYWMVGLTPEEYHWTKGVTWAQLRAYRLGAHHFRKLLTHSESAAARVWLGWCYGNLGMSEVAAQHFRQAYAQKPHPETALFLAQAELRSGNPERARALLGAIDATRQELNQDFSAELRILEETLGSRPR